MTWLHRLRSALRSFTSPSSRKSQSPKIGQADSLAKLMTLARRIFGAGYGSELIKCSELRRGGLKLERQAGLERAHKLSLLVAVELWKKVHGHPGISPEQRVELATALSSPYNLYYTCRHTNRVDHVLYDNEIVRALNNRLESRCLSSGARIRLRQVEAVLKQMDRATTGASPSHLYFIRRSRKLIQQLP